jgi:hypothetical protein
MFKYQSELPKLMYAEYGRNVQCIAVHLLTIEDQEKRTQGANALIEMMALLVPTLKQSLDYKEKLWNHLFHMTDYKLNVLCPYPIVPVDEIVVTKAEVLAYPGRGPKIKHYGKYVERMVTKALSTEDSEKKEAFTEIIGNFMKLVYKNWNNETVTDEQIVVDLKIMSGGGLDVSNSKLDVLHRSHAQVRKQQFSGKGNQGAASPAANTQNNKNLQNISTTGITNGQPKKKFKKFKKRSNPGF